MTDPERPEREDVGLALEPGADAALQARLLDAISRAPSPTRSAAQGRDRLVWGLAIGTAIAVFVYADGFREWGAPRTAPQIAVTFGGAVALAVAALRVGYGRGRSMVGRPSDTLLAMAWSTPLALFLWKYGWSAQFPGGTVLWPDRVGYRCLTLAMLTGGAVLAAMITARRGSDAVRPRLTGAAMGVSAGAVAAVFTELWCPVGHPGHIALGHVLPMIALGALGALPGSLVLKIRPAR